MSKNGITKKVKLDDITLDGGTQIREKLCQETVAEYAAVYEAGSKFPPLKVCSDGSTYWLYDGFHRWHANKKAGGSYAEVEVFQGTLRDAVLLACGANPDHGLKRSNKDKRRAVERLLNDPEWVLWSDNRIAEAAAVHHSTVADIRSQLAESASSQAAKAADQPRVGKDGKARKPPKPKANAVSAYFEGKAGENGAKPKRQKNGAEKSPAKAVDELKRTHVSPLVKGIDGVAESLGWKRGTNRRGNHKAADAALNSLLEALGQMREGKL